MVVYYCETRRLSISSNCSTSYGVIIICYMHVFNNISSYHYIIISDKSGTCVMCYMVLRFNVEPEVQKWVVPILGETMGVRACHFEF